MVEQSIGASAPDVTADVVAKRTILYILTDPRDGKDNEVRYVGKTVETLGIRRSNHITATHSGDRQHTRVARWIRQVLAAGLKPDIEQIDEAYEDWQERERYWIRWYRERGARLTNLTDGGEGAPGYRHTPESKALIAAAARNISAETRAKMGETRRNMPAEQREKIAASSRGRTHTPEARAKIGDAHRGMKHTPEAIGKMRAASTGRVVSEQARALISAAHTGKVNSPETRARMSAAQTGRICKPETREKLRQANLGKKASDETKAKLSAASTGRTHSPETVEKLRTIHVGRVVSDETRARMRAAKSNISPETRARMSAGQRRRLAKQSFPIVPTRFDHEQVAAGLSPKPAQLEMLL